MKLTKEQADALNEMHAAAQKMTFAEQMEAARQVWLNRPSIKGDDPLMLNEFGDVEGASSILARAMARRKK